MCLSSLSMSMYMVTYISMYIAVVHAIAMAQDVRLFLNIFSANRVLQPVNCVEQIVLQPLRVGLAMDGGFQKETPSDSCRPGCFDRSMLVTLLRELLSEC